MIKIGVLRNGLMIKTSSVWVLAAMLMVFTGSAFAGGDWKMGPFGPYWDDNDWPEFTPMYWMEEFMNRLDDDDDEIQDWMRRNQNPGQVAVAPTYILPVQPYPNWNAPYPADRPQLEPGYRPFARPDTYPPRHEQIERGRGYSRPAPSVRNKPLPELTPEEFKRMPEHMQREYERAFMDRYFSQNNRARDIRRSKPRSYREYRPRRRSTPDRLPKGVR